MSDITHQETPEVSSQEVTKSPVTILGIVSQIAENPNYDVEKMRTLLEMQQQVEDRRAEIEFRHAMSEASGEIPQVNKRGRVSLGGKGGYSFTRWEDMDTVIRPILTKYGLSLSFTTRSSANGMRTIIGKITHRNGKYQTAEMDLPLDTGQTRNQLQAFGSTLSYGKRYCTEMLLNIVRCNEDTDGVPPVDDREKITAEQKEMIIEKLERLQMGPERVLAFCEVSRVDDIPSEKFKKVFNRLNSILKEREAGYENS